MIKVMLVEDQRLFREGVEAIIKNTDDIQVTGTAQCGRSAIEMLKQQQPDVVLMDIHMPEMDGIKTTVHIKENHPGVKVVMLTSMADEELVIRGINVGADGFLLKDLYAERLIQSIRDAARGQPVLSGEVAQILVDKIRELTLDDKQILSKRLENRGINLTVRELDIIYLFMDGHSNKKIAQKLFLGEGTIKNYISEIYSKLNIHKRHKAIEYLKNLLK
ncbi:response regulator [Virgibacillus doumboii]|uniref:response regulator n=1 Tax=Virgibacillus doumboii TaxID=2697503 RepID=UPI0013DEE73F|nr:response regulator transcription factor [Virgibacillus doumboii]